MLQKFLLVQIVVLVIEIGLGMSLVNQYDADLKMVHRTVGLLVGISTLATLCVAIRQKVSGGVMALSAATLAFVILAIVGGKVTATDYDQGLMLMRASAIAAFILSLVCLYVLRKSTQR